MGHPPVCAHSDMLGVFVRSSSWLQAVCVMNAVTAVFLPKKAQAIGAGVVLSMAAAPILVCVKGPFDPLQE